jgi:zinc transport system substrate-binding protein
MKYFSAVIGVVVVGALGYYLVNIQPSAPSDKLQVVTSFYPLYFLAREIGGGAADIRNITPAGAEPHAYEPTPRDMIAIENADLLVINGAGFEPWGDAVLGGINRERTRVVVAGEGLATLTTAAHEEEGEEEGAGHEEAGEVVDPHVWLSPRLAQTIAERIRDGYIAADPAGEPRYRANADAVMGRLAELDAAFARDLQNCARREIITSHAAFGYIARDYGLEQVAISGLSPEEEPSPKQLADIAKFARDNNVKHIFFETLVSPKLSETIATEVGARTLVLNPLEGLTNADTESGKDYFSEMRQNLASLKTALQCH